MAPKFFFLPIQAGRSVADGEKSILEKMIDRCGPDSQVTVRKNSTKDYK